MLTEYPINSRVFVSISRSIPAGLLGRVEDGPRAIIRNREIAWGEPTEVEDLVGQTRAAVVVGYNRAYEQLELSLRLVEWDPWQEVASRYHEDSEVEGRVVGLTEGGAFVELEPGIEGFMPASDLLPQFVPRIEDWLWINDLVKALVTEVDPSRRRLRLGLKRLLLRREARFKRQVWGGYPQATPSEVTLAEILPADTRLQLLRMMPEPESLVFEPQVRVLIIEDDEDYGAGLHNFLQRNGCRVIRTQDGPAGLGQVQEQQPPFDLILIDWNLPGLQGHQVVHELQRLGCPSRLAIVLEPAPLRDQPDIWESLWASGVDVFSKTDGDQCRIGILSILRELRIDGSEPEPTHRRSSPRPLAPSLSQQASTTRAEEQRPVLGKRPDLQQALEAVQHDTRASTAALLRLEPGHAQLQMEGCAGKPFPLEEAPPDLIYSPLNDVLQKGQEIWERVGDTSTKFRRLLDLMPFQGFLGLSLPAMGSARYGLILLKERGSFGRGQRQRARTALYLIAGIVQERRLTRALQPWQAQNLVGQLVNSVVHEVTNKLGGLEYQVEALQDGLRELARWPEKAQEATFLRELEQATERIVDVQVQASQLRNRYLGLTAVDQPQWVDLKALAEEMICVLRPEAQQQNIVLRSSAPEDLPPVWARPSQLRQVFLNLMLNAIQQMAAAGRQGTVAIEMSFAPGAVCPVQIRFRDEGCGIHYQLWGHVFDFGFTTKKEGAGLGLTVSRQIAANLGGNLQVEESHVLWGTTFLLEMPAAGSSQAAGQQGAQAQGIGS